MNLEEQERLNQRNIGLLPQKEKKYWFKPKPYGLGVIPVTWEGWGVSLLFGAFIFGLAWYNGIFDEANAKNKKEISFAIEVLVFLLMYMKIIHNYTKGGLKWRWGLKK